MPVGTRVPLSWSDPCDGSVFTESHHNPKGSYAAGSKPQPGALSHLRVSISPSDSWHTGSRTPNWALGAQVGCQKDPRFMWLQENLSSASLLSPKPSEPFCVTRVTVGYGHHNGKIVKHPTAQKYKKTAWAKGPILHTPLPLHTQDVAKLSCVTKNRAKEP